MEVNNKKPEMNKPLGGKRDVEVVVDENGMAVASKWKSGLRSMIFSRLTLIVVLFALQAVLMLMLWGMFGQLLTRIASWGITAFEIIILVYMINTDIDATAKITWLLVIAIVPLFGALFFLWTRAEVGHRKIAARVNEITDSSRGTLKQDEQVMKRLESVDRDSASVARYTVTTGNFPVYENTKVTYFPFGQDKFAEMLVRLENAKKFIFLEYFIIQEGYMWGKILEILSRKVQEGVEVRVLFDGTNYQSKVPMDYDERLRSLGIQCRVWAPIRPVVTSTYNYRDHRKILVIDGEVAFNGGVNLADEYINRTHPYGDIWKDTAVMVEGDAVTSFTLMFLTTWSAAFTSREERQRKRLSEEERNALKREIAQNAAASYFSQNIPAVRGANGFVLPYGDSPLDEYKVGEMVYMDILNTAEDYVYIMTPYLILDGELETALKFAAERGVDVRLILPGVPDKKAVYALAKATCPPLIKSGVKIYTYTPGFVHAKVFVSDDSKAVVGTINLDYRSLYHHFECATYMAGTSCIADIKEDFLKTLEDCEALTLETLKNDSIITRGTGAVLKMIAPML